MSNRFADKEDMVNAVTWHGSGSGGGGGGAGDGVTIIAGHSGKGGHSGQAQQSRELIQYRVRVRSNDQRAVQAVETLSGGLFDTMPKQDAPVRDEYGMWMSVIELEAPMVEGHSFAVFIAEREHLNAVRRMLGEPVISYENPDDDDLAKPAPIAARIEAARGKKGKG